MNETALEVITKVLDGSESGKREAAAILRRDGIVALPTETVYGLAGNALSLKALNKIYEAKNRPADNPLIWHVHSAECALKLFDRKAMREGVLKRFELLAEHFWPGPLTLVAKKAPGLPGALASIAVRIPRPALTLDILRDVNFPLAMPSANLSSRPSPTSCLHVLKTLNGRIDAIVDGGTCDGGVESTVLLIDEPRPKILRQGLISRTKLALVLDESVITHQKEQGPLASPGQAYLHYAPAVGRISLQSARETVTAWREGHTIIGRKLDIDELKRKNKPRPSCALTIALDNDPEHFAQTLYGALYEAEERPQSELILVMPPTSEPWAAILDRLTRAAGGSSGF